MKHIQTRLIVCLFLVVVASSCKKDEKIEPVNFKVLNKKMNTPGFNEIQAFLYPQANGKFTSTYGGGIVFSDIIRKSPGNYYEGERVFSLSIEDLNGEFLSIQTVGPFFVVIRPTFVGNITAVRDSVNKFQSKFEDFIDRRRDPVTQRLYQPSLPSLDSLLVGVDGSIVIRGQVVMSSASPSGMSIVPSSFYATPPTQYYTLLPELMYGNLRIDLAGDGNGNIMEAQIFNTSTNTIEPVYGFSGTYTSGSPTTVTNLKVWTSPTSFISYSGPLAF